MVNHNQVRDELAEQLKHSDIEPGCIHTEYHVDPPVVAGTGRIDVVWEFSDTARIDEDVRAQGVAFEIKTRLPNQSKTHVRTNGIYQLHRSALSEYYPVLVASRDVYEDTSGAVPSLKRLIKTIGASYLEVREHPLEFSFVYDSLSVKIDVPDLLY